MLDVCNQDKRMVQMIRMHKRVGKANLLVLNYAISNFHDITFDGDKLELCTQLTSLRDTDHRLSKHPPEAERVFADSKSQSS